jgi:hypothetical protein
VTTTRHENDAAILRQRVCYTCHQPWVTREVQVPGTLRMGSIWPPRLEAAA